MPHKCSNCGTPDHRATYCPKCMAIYRKVCRWKSLHKGQHTFVATKTDAGTVYHYVPPDADVAAWLTKRGKMPDVEAAKEIARLKSARSVLSAG